jgi:branched-chain amino acid transport system permease protein
VSSSFPLNGSGLMMVHPVHQTDKYLPPTMIMGLILVCWPLLVADARLYYQVFGVACLFAALALAWNIHALTGAISLGHAAFFGLGAYAACLLEYHWHWPVLLAIALGPIAAAVYGVLWAIAFQRLRGAYFALATLAAAEIPKVVIDNWDTVTFGSLGLMGVPGLPSIRVAQWGLVNGTEPGGQYYLLLAFMTLLGWVHRGAIQSRWGWAIRAIREDEIAASSIGIDVFRKRLQAITLSSYLTAVCGALYAHVVGLIEPGLVFNLHVSSLPLVFTMFGGRFQVLGPILGALLLYPLDQLVFHPWLPAGHLALYGLAIVVTFIFFPQGVAGWLQQRLKSASN